MGADLTYVFRSLARRPAFAATIVGTLALGLGLVAGILSFADGYLFRPLPFPSPDQLYRVRDPQARIALLQRDTIALRQTAVGPFGFVEWSAGSRISGRAILVEGRRVPVWSFDVTPGFADTLKLPLVAGRPFAAADHSAGTAIPVWASYRFWKGEFGGDPGVLGRSFQIEGQDASTVTVVGILAPEIASFDLNKRFSQKPGSIAGLQRGVLGFQSTRPGTGELLAQYADPATPPTSGVYPSQALTVSPVVI